MSFPISDSCTPWKCLWPTRATGCGASAPCDSRGIRLYSTLDPSLLLTHEELEFAVLVQLLLSQVRTELERDILDLFGVQLDGQHLRLLLWSRVRTSSSSSYSSRSSSVSKPRCGSTSTRCHALLSTGSRGLRRLVWPGIAMRYKVCFDHSTAS